MGRLSDNLFYAQEKSHKHWLLSLDNLGLRTARRGRIHNLGFRTARRGRIHNPGLRTARRGRIYNLGLRTACGRRIQKKRPRVSPKGPSPQTTKHGDRHKRTVPVCPPRVSQKDRPRVSPKRTVPVCLTKGPKHGDRHKRTVPVCPPRVSPSPCVPKRTVPADHKTWGQTQKDRPRVSCSCLSAFYHAKIFSAISKRRKEFKYAVGGHFSYK